MNFLDIKLRLYKPCFLTTNKQKCISTCKERACVYYLVLKISFICLYLYIWYRSFERTTPIYFEKLVLDETQSAGDYLRDKTEIISLASTHSLADIIPMGLCINSTQLANHMDYFRHHLTGMSPRLPEIYATYRLFAH